MDKRDLGPLPKVSNKPSDFERLAWIDEDALARLKAILDCIIENEGGDRDTSIRTVIDYLRGR